MSRLFNQVTQLNLRQTWPYAVAVTGVLALLAWTRLADLGGYVIVDEADRWRWAGDFYRALLAGDLRATLVGDGYPGIVPVWLETLWLLAESARQSLLAGRWFGDEGVYMLFHIWSRSTHLLQQRLPIVLFNTIITLVIMGSIWRLFGKKVALVGGILIALDPFYLSDSRVNRAEAVITGLMTLSILFLIFYDRKRQWRYVILSGILGGLSFLTKIQALTLLPAIALIGLWVSYKPNSNSCLACRHSLLSLTKLGLLWSLTAVLTWCLLWPAMWVIPLDTLTLVYNYTTRKVDTEGVNLFFWGQTYQNTDPGLFFYPVVFFMRITPLALLGLAGFVPGVMYYVARNRSKGSAPSLPMVRGSLMLVIYVLAYAALMTWGSHKQDRYLLPIFVAIDILAALGLIYLGGWLKSKLASRLSPLASRCLLPTAYGLLLSLQLLTVLPHHPYYYSYFNPLFGGGQTAVRWLRVGWGEGMDQVGVYLAAKPNSRQLVVSSRFTHNILDFKGKLISLGQDGRWTQADYIVLYIQQVQRRLDPSPGFIDYFQARQPEKVITIGGIDYAWIYPIPFTVPANPLLSVIPNQAALLGYSWQDNQVRVWWENQGLAPNRQLVARLVGHNTATAWTVCAPDPHFVAQSGQMGAYVESLCAPAIATLPPGTYTVEFGLTSQEGRVESFLFPQGRQAAQITPGGQAADTGDLARLEAMVAEVIPPAGQRINRVYDGRIRLAAFQLEPAIPTPGETVSLSLYWQPISEILTPITLTVQLADSRLMPLGGSDVALYNPSLPAIQSDWLPGNVVTTGHKFTLPSHLDTPLAVQLEVELKNDAAVPLKVTTQTGAALDKVVARLTVPPAAWPTLTGVTPVKAVWAEDIALRGYTASPQSGKPGETVIIRLFWQASQPVTGNYVVFVHLLDEAGQLKMQHDSLPRVGAYPTPWWPPGQLVEDSHPLALPPDLSPGAYRLVIGLYRLEDGARLSLVTGRDSFDLGTIEVR